MFAQVELPVGGKGKVLTVPNSAVIDSGTRRIVLVQLAEGRFEPREVKLGSRTDTYVEVMDGVKDGEQVVVAANFLIDAESNLKAAIGGFGHSGHGATPAAGATTPPSTTPAMPAGTVDYRRRRDRIGTRHQVPELSAIGRKERSRPSTRNLEACPLRTGRSKRSNGRR